MSVVVQLHVSASRRKRTSVSAYFDLRMGVRLSAKRAAGCLPALFASINSRNDITFRSRRTFPSVVALVAL
jgi:hypothetical protein